MEPSAKLIDATAQAEGFSATPYWDVDGYSIGHGHHGPDVIPGMHWTLDQARLQLVVDIQSSADDVNRLVKVSLTQGQFDCLTDFRFNVGPGSFAGSTLLKILNQAIMTERLRSSTASMTRVRSMAGSSPAGKYLKVLKIAV